jgi:hypothetical protein
MLELTTEKLNNTFTEFGTDKGPRRHSYGTMYSKVFAGLPEDLKLLEVGILGGDSLRAWRSLLPNATIHGAEANPASIAKLWRDHPDFVPNIADYIYGGDSRIPKGIQSEIKLKEIVYDVIVDDGDHRVNSQWETFMQLNPFWSKVYVIEDVEGIEAAETLRKRLNSVGVREVTICSSLLKNQEITRLNKTIDYYGIIAQR